MKTGLVSVTFRQMDIPEIIRLTKAAKLDGIEWGADVHVLPNDFEKAKKVAAVMRENELETISYGSYYKLAKSDNFDAILETAKILNTKNIRVWAGDINSEDADELYWNNAVADAKRIAKLSKKYNISISFEYHGNTLTNTQKSTVKLLNAIDMDNVFTYWQPLANTTHEENIKNIKELTSMNKLMNVHAYQWRGTDVFYLEDGLNEWQQYANLAKETCNAILLEFVKDAKIDSFVADAKTLNKIIKGEK